MPCKCEGCRSILKALRMANGIVSMIDRSRLPVPAHVELAATELEGLLIVMAENACCCNAEKNDLQQTLFGPADA